MMRNVTVTRSDLLEALRQNQARHRQQFEDALEGWRQRVLEALEQALEDARAGRRFRTNLQLPQPSDHTADYERAIRMLEMETRGEVEIDYATFTNLVLDDWGWKRDFLLSNRGYSEVVAASYAAEYGDDES